MPVSVRSTLGIAALAALLWTGAEIRSLTSAGTPLHRLPAAPHGGISLQLASSPEEAQAIRNAWACRGLDLPTPCEDVTPVARQALARDSRFIAAYSLAFILTILWSAGSTQPSRRFVLLLFGLLAIGVACDLVENWALATTLGVAGEMPVNGVMSMFPGWRAALEDPGPSDRFEQAVTLARTASMTKFAALLLAAVGTLALVGGAVRLFLLARRAVGGPDVAVPPPNAQPKEGNKLAAIEELLRRENAGIFPAPHSRAPDVPLIEDNLATDEPRVLFRAADVIGLALSGGGIRSATFNLGLLQGLHRLNLLALVDYLSTVSGGGYVGSFWSEWIARRQAALQQTAPGVATPQVPPALLFPSHRDAGSGPQDAVDRPAGASPPRVQRLPRTTLGLLRGRDLDGARRVDLRAAASRGDRALDHRRSPDWLAVAHFPPRLPVPRRGAANRHRHHRARPGGLRADVAPRETGERRSHRDHGRSRDAGRSGGAGHLALPLRVARLHRARRLAAVPAAGSLRARHAVPAAGVRGRVARGAGAERLRAVVDRHRHRVGRQALAVQPAAPGLLGGLAGGLADHGRGARSLSALAVHCGSGIARRL